MAVVEPKVIHLDEGYLAHKEEERANQETRVGTEAGTKKEGDAEGRLALHLKEVGLGYPYPYQTNEVGTKDWERMRMMLIGPQVLAHNTLGSHSEASPPACSSSQYEGVSPRISNCANESGGRVLAAS
ncbi:uncharacterized protein A4U43_C05F15800 [Asparagus officinalis]|uniref:Uncharacterized protein n=1 Tax=Asparagus officinalis TaxID=4686 RepID=A0A5P1ERW7_ASPOF|nr:uncharacterized protein A4U43_C05F15800 [Asparagus officinalis]